MTADGQEDEAARGGDRRGDDRRGGDRRALERRKPPPVWRRPWALVSYGVVGALALVFLLNAFDADEEEIPAGEVVAAPPPATPTSAPPAARSGAPMEAYAASDFERLVIEGEAAQGKRVRTQLFCDAPTPVALRQNAVRVESAVAALRDQQGRVVAADCKWGPSGDERRQDFLLLIPPELADDFSAQPVTTDDFVRRRRVVAEVEWIGRSEALSIRTAGVLRAVLAR